MRSSSRSLTNDVLTLDPTEVTARFSFFKPLRRPRLCSVSMRLSRMSRSLSYTSSDGHSPTIRWPLPVSLRPMTKCVSRPAILRWIDLPVAESGTAVRKLSSKSDPTSHGQMETRRQIRRNLARNPRRLRSSPPWRHTGRSNHHSPHHGLPHPHVAPKTRNRSPSQTTHLSSHEMVHTEGMFRKPTPDPDMAVHGLTFPVRGPGVGSWVAWRVLPTEAAGFRGVNRHPIRKTTITVSAISGGVC